MSELPSPNEPLVNYQLGPAVQMAMGPATDIYLEAEKKKAEKWVNYSPR